MRSFSLSELNRRPGVVVDMALAAPVALTKHGRRSVVILSAEAYDALLSGSLAAEMDLASGAGKTRTASSFLLRQAIRPAATGED